jgi:hypothetical protein
MCLDVKHECGKKSRGAIAGKSGGCRGDYFFAWIKKHKLARHRICSKKTSD